MFFVNIPIGDSSSDVWYNSSAKFALKTWGGQLFKDLATYSSGQKGCLDSSQGIYWVKFTANGKTDDYGNNNDGVTLYRYDSNQSTDPDDKNNWNRLWLSDSYIGSYYLRKKWGTYGPGPNDSDTSSGDQGFEFDYQQDPGFHIVGTDKSQTYNWGTVISTSSGTNGVWEKTLTLTANNISDGKFYFRPVIGTQEFGPTTSTSDVDATSGAYIGVNTGKSYYAAASAGQTATIKVDMKNSTVTCTISGSGSGGDTDYTYTGDIWLRYEIGNWDEDGYDGHWTSEDNLKFTQTATNIWWLTLSSPLPASTTKFKIYNSNTGTEDKDAYLGNEASGISPDTRYQIWARDKSANMSPAAQIKAIKVEYDTEDGQWYMTYYSDQVASNVIQYVRVVEKSSGSYITLKSANGVTWTGSGTINSIVSSPSSSDYDSYRYYISTSTNGSTWTSWVPSSATDTNYWMSPNSTKTLTQNTNSYYLCFKTGATTSNDEADVTVTVTLNDEKTAAASMKYIVGASAMGVNMPLKESDFFEADGVTPKPHYFFVGVRTAGWRLLPEWEMTKNSTGVYQLTQRLMYNGHFGIARVDTYQEYIMHQYTEFYSKGGGVLKSGTTSLTLDKYDSSANITGCVTDKSTTRTNTAFWSLSRGLSKTNVWWDPAENSAAAYEESMPCYVTSMTFDPNSKVISVNSTTDQTEIGSHLSFTFVGSNIRYDNDGDYTIKGKGWYTNASGDGYGWGDGWYSWDTNGKPYIDGYGKPLYLTAFNEEWISEHPAYFYDESKDFYYSSDNLTFVHYTDLEDYENDPYINVYKAHPAGISGASSTIPAKITTSGWNYQEVFKNFGGASETSYERSDWQCFVVKDVWLHGDFKVWTGWGGASSLNEGNQDKDQARWFTQNGGHNGDKTKYGVTSYDLSMGTTQVYGTKRDKYAADFRIVETATDDANPQAASDMQFYKRAILWYNPNVGFNGSVLQFVKEVDGPQIQAQRLSGVKNRLQYRWRIDASTTSTAIQSVKITRYKMQSDGTFKAEYTTEVVSSSENKTNLNYSAAFAANKSDFATDGTVCEQGVYYYEVSVLYVGATTPKTATSNRIIITYAGTPVTLTAAQLKDSSSKLRLGVTVSVAPKSDVLKQDYEYQSGELIGTTSTIANQVKGYYLVAESALAQEAAIADQDHTWLVAPAGGIDTYAYVDPAASTTETVKIAAGKYYMHVAYSGNESGFTVDLTRAAANKGVYNAASLSDYQFSAYLVLDDNDTNGWKALALGQATASTDVELPAPAISHSGLEIKKNTDRTNSDFPSNEKEMPLGALGYDGSKEMPVKYKDVNEIVLPVELTDDNLSDEIFNDGFKVNYIVTVYDKTSGDVLATKTISSAESKFGVVNINGDLRYVPVDATKLTANKVGAQKNIYYSLPGDYQVDVAIEAVDAAAEVSSSKSANSDKVTVTKLSTGSPAGFSATVSGSPYFDAPVLSWDWSQEYMLRHGAVKFSTSSTTETEDIISHVANKNLNLYLGQSVAGCETSLDGGWTQGHGANGGSYVPEAGFYDQGDGYTYAGLSGYVEYTGTYSDSNNWAQLAATSALNGNYLPLQVIPLALGTPVEAGKDVPAIDNNGYITVGGGTWVWYVPVYTISDESGRTMGFDLDSKLVISDGYDGGLDVVIAPKAVTTYSVIPFGVATSSIGTGGMGEMTGIESVGYEAPAAAEAVYYNLQGVRIENPAKGQIYLRVVGNTATKVLY